MTSGEHYEQHLRITACEEAGELIQELCKTLRFGVDEKVNARIVSEYSELVAVMEELGYHAIDELKKAKIRKVGYYYNKTYA